MDISVVPTKMIRSQWQALFLQMFPFNFSDLPQVDPSDRSCFERFWQGPLMSYESFMANAYPGFAIPAEAKQNAIDTP